MTPPVHVVVDALSVHHGGGATYLRHQLDALARVSPRLRLHVLATPRSARLLTAGLGADIEVHQLESGTRRVAWEQLVMPWISRPRGVLYNPGGVAPLGPARLPVVLALQNPNFFGPGLTQPHNRAWNRRSRTWLMRRSARRASRLVAVSQSFADAVTADLPTLAPRLHVIPSGAPSLPTERRRPAGLAADINGFVLSLSNDAPHKQLDVVVEAWVRSARREPSQVPLVMAGRRSPERAAALGALVPTELSGRFVQLGPVEDRREVAWLLEHASVSVCASTLESFGFTTAEAGAVGCPVIATDIPAHREVAGVHATYVSAGDPVALGDALIEHHRGPDAARPTWRWSHTWDDHARALAQVLTDAADHRPVGLVEVASP